MTDKQMIIDGVDVSGCEYYNKDDKTCREVNGKYETDICDFDKCENSNCYYKQLKRKEQECEELEEERNEYFELMAIRTEVLAKIANKLGMNTGIIENNELFCKIDQLKAENEKMSKGYAELTEIVSPYMDDFTGYNEELGGFDIVLCVKELLQQLDQLKAENDLYKNAHKTEQDRRRSYENALVEIKEIADKCFRHTAWEEYAKQLKQILQKISECEVGND